MVIIALVYALHVNERRAEETVANDLKRASNAFTDVWGPHTNLLKTWEGLQWKTNFWTVIQGLSNDCVKLDIAISNLFINVSSNYSVLNNPRAAFGTTIAKLTNYTAQLRVNSNHLAGLSAAHRRLTNDLDRALSLVRTNEMRFPKEYEAGKTPFHIILRHNQVYLTRDPTARGSSINTTGLKWTWGGDAETILVSAIPGRGIEPADRNLAAKLNSVDPARTYVICWVYADSFPAYDTLKDSLEKAKLDFGWKPAENNEAIKVTAERIRQPPPQKQ